MERTRSKTIQKKKRLNYMLIVAALCTVLAGLFSYALTDTAYAVTVSKQFVSIAVSDMSDTATEAIMTDVLNQKASEENGDSTTNRYVIRKEVENRISQVSEKTLVDKKIEDNDESIDKLIKATKDELTKTFTEYLKEQKYVKVSDVNSILKKLTDTTIAVFETDIKELQNEIRRIREKTEKIEENIIELKKIDQSNKSEILKITDKLTEDIDSVSVDVATINKKIDVQKRNRSLKSYVLKNGDNGFIKESIVDTTDMSVAQYVGYLIDNGDTYASAINELYSYVKNIESGLEKTNSNVELLSENLTKKAAELQSSIEQLKKASSSANENAIDTAKKNLESIEAELIELLQKNQDSVNKSQKDAVDSLLKQIDALKEKDLSTDTAIKQNLESVSNQISQITENIGTLNVSLQQNVTNVTSLSKVLETATNNISNLSEQVENIQSDVNKLQSDMGGLKIYEKDGHFYVTNGSVSKKLD